MRNLFGRMPLPVKLIFIGFLPLFFALYLSFSLYKEKSNKLKLFRNNISQIHQSALITKLIDQLQVERNFSYNFSLHGEGKDSMLLQRSVTDSLLSSLDSSGISLSDYRKYTFLSDLEGVRKNLDNRKYPANQVIHFYTSTVFRLNTLNTIPAGASIHLPSVYPELVSQKLLSDMITYLGIVNTNIYNVLYTKQYMIETLMGTIGSYEVYKSYEQEFLLRGAPEAINDYRQLMDMPVLKSTVSYVDTLFSKFSFDSTYDYSTWAQQSGEAIALLRNMQKTLLEKVETSLNREYVADVRSNDTTLLITLILLVLIIGFLIYSIHAINRSLFRLKASAELIARGEGSQLPTPLSNDAISSLAQSISKISESNARLAEVADAIGHGDFEIPVVSRSEKDLLGNAINRMKVNLREFTQELESNEARTWQMLQSLPACVYTCELDGRIKLYNNAAVQLWGEEPDQSRKWNGAWKMFTPEGRELRRDEYPMARVMNDAKETEYEKEVIIQRPDGTKRYAIAHPQAIRDKDGKIISGISMMVDITERKDTERDTARLAAIVDSNFDAIVSKTLTGIITSWNPGAERLFGYKAEEMIGAPITKIIPPERRNEEPEIIGKIQRGEKIEHFETQRITKDGRRIDISLSLSPVVDRKGNIIGVSKIARDITEKLESARRLKENDERLRMAISSTNLGTWDYSPASNKLIWSEECKRIYDISIDAEVDLDFFFNRVHPADVARVKEEMAAALEHSGNGDFSSSFRILRDTDQSIRWVQSKGKASFSPGGNVERFIGTLIDITEQEESRRALEESEQRARLAIEAAEMGTFEWDLITDKFKLSERLKEILGHAGKTVDVSVLREFIHPEDRHIRKKAVEEAMEKGSLNYEVRIIWPDGSLHWVNIYGKMIYDESRRPQRMYGTVEDTTEVNRLVKSLEENEARLNIAIAAAELGTWELDFVTKDLKYSSRYLELMGYSSKDNPTHEDLLRRIHPDDLELRNLRIEEALRTGTLDMELRVSVPGKDINWIRAKASVFYDKNGKPSRLMGTIMDVTDQKTAYHVLQESEERFKIIANTAPVMIWMSGEDRFSDFFNNCWLDFTGRTIEQERGDGWLEGVYHEDVEYCKKTYLESHASMKPFYIEYRLRRKDGMYRWISDNAVPRFDGNGEFIGFISACSDIDDEKKFNLKLQESELLFKTITNVSPVGLWMTDEHGRNNFLNDTWIEWAGGTGADRDNSDWMRVVIAADQEYVAKKFANALKSRKVFNAEFRIKRKDGQVRWVLSEGSPYFDLDGNFAGYAGSVADITERKEDEIRKNEFLAVASHELKTPLTSVKAYTQLLAATYQKANDNFLKNALGKVENQVNKMTKLVGDFLNLSKIESDKFQVDAERFDITSLTKEVVSDIQLVALNHDIRVLDGESITVKADKEKIAQVLINFLNNAIKYSPLGKEIVVVVSKESDQVKLAVTDRGIGIKPEEHQKIFQRFYRSKFNQNISYSGFGIGLYISAEIIQRHEGSIGVISKEGKGSTFYFTLPLAE